jgi:ketosteroid isomerase-like protein
MAFNPGKLAAEWVAAWNAHDLDRVLALYSDDFEMASPAILTGGHDPSGSLRGKANVAAYWRKALARFPGLRFDLKRVYASPNSIVISYANTRGDDVCEYLQVDADGLIVRGAAHHG